MHAQVTARLEPLVGVGKHGRGLFGVVDAKVVTGDVREGVGVERVGVFEVATDEPGLAAMVLEP